MNTTTTTPRTATSADGTTIAYQACGDGPPVVLIGGAFNDRSTVAGLAAALAPNFTAIAYDRRGRGDSDDQADAGDYAVERETEDLAAVIDSVGGSAGLFGHSSGGLLALEAVLHGLPIDKVAVYEPSYVPDGSGPRPPADLLDRLKALVKDGDSDAAAELFLHEQVGVPAPMLSEMRAGQAWGFLTGLAHTLPYDLALSSPGRLSAGRLATIAVPTLAINGDQTQDWLQAATRTTADAIPGARHNVLAGQDHGVLHNPGALRPLLADFFEEAH
jgi:pimeloyl-ACP methyl ester carboxylesterase